MDYRFRSNDTGSARSVDRLIENTPFTNKKGDVQMKKLLKAFSMAIIEGCAAYAETFHYVR